MDGVMDLLQTNPFRVCRSKTGETGGSRKCIILHIMLINDQRRGKGDSTDGPLFVLPGLESFIRTIGVSIWKETAMRLRSVFRVERSECSGECLLREFKRREWVVHFYLFKPLPVRDTYLHGLRNRGRRHGLLESPIPKRRSKVVGRFLVLQAVSIRITVG